MSFRTLSSVFAAFLAACLAPALMALGLIAGLGILTRDHTAIPFGLAIAMGIFVAAAFHAVPLGVPAFAIGYWMRRVTQRTCVILGFFIGAIPITIIEIASRIQLADGQPPVPLVIAFAVLFACCGALSGWTFWTILKWTDALPQINRARAPA